MPHSELSLSSAPLWKRCRTQAGSNAFSSCLPSSGSFHIHLIHNMDLSLFWFCQPVQHRLMRCCQNLRRAEAIKEHCLVVFRKLSVLKFCWCHSFPSFAESTHAHCLLETSNASSLLCCFPCRHQYGLLFWLLQGQN